MYYNEISRSITIENLAYIFYYRQIQNIKSNIKLYILFMYHYRIKMNYGDWSGYYYNFPRNYFAEAKKIEEDSREE